MFSLCRLFLAVEISGADLVLLALLAEEFERVLAWFLLRTIGFALDLSRLRLLATASERCLVWALFEAVES